MRRAFVPVLFTLALSGCGYISDVQPPLANVPAAIQNLAAVQRGGRIIVEFAVPRRTTEDKPIPGDLTLDVRIGTAPVNFRHEDWEAAARPVRNGKVENGVARFQTSSAEWTGREAIVAARAVGANGKASAWSNYAIVEVVPAPEQPREVAAAPSPEGVRVSWRAEGKLFRVFRRAGEQGPWAPVAEVAGQEWTDAGVEFGTRYAYRVETVAKLARGAEAASEVSAEASITPQDVFPPAAPRGLRAAAAPNSIELSWDANPEPFVAGYRVYRSDGGEFAKVADVGLVPTYSDRGVATGKTYRYRITAVGKSGRESQASETVEASLP